MNGVVFATSKMPFFYQIRVCTLIIISPFFFFNYTLIEVCFAWSLGNKMCWRSSCCDPTRCLSIRCLLLCEPWCRLLTSLHGHQRDWPGQPTSLHWTLDHVFTHMFVYMLNFGDRCFNNLFNINASHIIKHFEINTYCVFLKLNTSNRIKQYTC